MMPIRRKRGDHVMVSAGGQLEDTLVNEDGKATVGDRMEWM